MFYVTVLVWQSGCVSIFSSLLSGKQESGTPEEDQPVIQWLMPPSVLSSTVISSTALLFAPRFTRVPPRRLHSTLLPCLPYITLQHSSLNKSTTSCLRCLHFVKYNLNSNSFRPIVLIAYEAHTVPVEMLSFKMCF